MTQQALQPNPFAAGLRRALDIVRDQDALRARVFDGVEDQRRLRENDCAAHFLSNILDALADQLLDAGGFLGNEPEPEVVHTIELPRRFWDDHCDRLSPDCSEIEGARYSTVIMTDDQLTELLDDAKHYAGGWADEAPAGLIASARATVERINKHLETLEVKPCN